MGGSVLGLGESFFFPFFLFFFFFFFFLREGAAWGGLEGAGLGGRRGEA